MMKIRCDGCLCWEYPDDCRFYDDGDSLCPDCQRQVADALSACEKIEKRRQRAAQRQKAR